MLAPVVSFGVAKLGFPRLLDLLGRLPPRGRDLGSSVGVVRGEALLRKAFRVAPARGACLDHAVVQYLLHRWLGPEPRLVVGVKRRAAAEPASWVVDAHAWVEEAGGPPREEAFRPLLALTPTRGLERFDAASTS